jgi:hypothetical protein
MSEPPRHLEHFPPHVAVDAHVHLHDPAQDLAALEAAARNFADCSPVASSTGALMLADLQGAEAYERLRNRAAAGSAAFRVTAEEESLWYHTRGWRLLIVAGRQIVSSERLEVLALATRARIPDGLPLPALLERLAEEDALAVLPWGCGKWLGARGAVVRRALKAASSGGVFLGDNGGRPSWWRDTVLEAAMEQGVHVLPGTDPLPIEGEWRRIGAFGCTFDAELSSETPASDLKRILRSPGLALRRYGRLESSARFLRNQLRLRLGAGRGRSVQGALPGT